LSLLSVRLVGVIKWTPVEIVSYLIRGHFHATCPHLIYVVKGFETYGMKGPTSII